MNLNSGLPFSLIKYGLPYNYPTLRNNITVDIAILGGGISGALMAHHLMEAGNECIVLDCRTIGLGSTCASTSLLQYEIDVPLCELQHKIGLNEAVTAYKLCAEAIDKLGSIAKKTGSVNFEKKKSLYFAAHKKDIAFLEEECLIRKQHGFDVRLLNEAQVENDFHIIAPAAILSSQAAQTNAYNFTHAIHQYNIKKGIEVYDRTEAVSIEHGKNRVVLKTNRGYTIKAKKLIYANGYEAVNYIDKKIVELESTYAICSEQMNLEEIPFNTKALMWNTAEPYLYMRTTKDNRIIMGGRDEEFYNPKKRDVLIPKKTKQLAADFNKLFPGSIFRTEFSWTGVFGSTKDGLPFIGPYKKLSNSYFALGYGGNGITFSLIAAEILTDMINGKKHEHNRVFSFERL